jgi:hypothetical protein
MAGLSGWKQIVAALSEVVRNEKALRRDAYARGVYQIEPSLAESLLGPLDKEAMYAVIDKNVLESGVHRAYNIQHAHAVLLLASMSLRATFTASSPSMHTLAAHASATARTHPVAAHTAWANHACTSLHVRSLRPHTMLIVRLSLKSLSWLYPR